MSGSSFNFDFSLYNYITKAANIPYFRSHHKRSKIKKIVLKWAAPMTFHFS